jgi:transposase
LKERLYGYTQDEIFDRKSREKIRKLSGNPVVRFQINQLMDRLDRDEGDVEILKERVLLAADPYMARIDMLTRMKGESVFIAIAIIADIIEAGRFKDSKHFTSYLRSAPRAANSNTTEKNRGTKKMGRKLSATLLTQWLNHVMNSSGKPRRRYERLCEYKKAGLVRTGLRRRVFAEIYQMLKKGEYHYGRDPANHEMKMAQYRWFLEKQKKEAVSQKAA